MCGEVVTLQFPSGAQLSDTGGLEENTSEERSSSQDASELNLKWKPSLVRDPYFRTVTIFLTGGAVTFSSVGAAFGGAVGVGVGSLVGLGPALFTLGLSIPCGAAAGGIVGLSSGAALGCVTGAAAGSAAGHLGYKHQAALARGALHVKFAARGHAQGVCLLFGRSSQPVARRSIASLRRAQKLKVAAISAATGGFVCGAAGAVSGTAAGGTTGAAVGLLAMPFTFGLSLPFCTVVGGSIGLCTGAAAGGAGGIAVGAAAGLHADERARRRRSALAWGDVPTSARSGSLPHVALQGKSRTRSNSFFSCDDDNHSTATGGWSITDGMSAMSHITASFRKPDRSIVDIIFTLRPLGVTFNRGSPPMVKSVACGQHGALAGVQIGWELVGVNNESLVGKEPRVIHASFGAAVGSLEDIREYEELEA